MVSTMFTLAACAAVMGNDAAIWHGKQEAQVNTAQVNTAQTKANVQTAPKALMRREELGKGNSQQALADDLINAHPRVPEGGNIWSGESPHLKPRRFESSHHSKPRRLMRSPKLSGSRSASELNRRSISQDLNSNSCDEWVTTSSSGGCSSVHNLRCRSDASTYSGTNAESTCCTNDTMTCHRYWNEEGVSDSERKDGVTHLHVCEVAAQTECCLDAGTTAAPSPSYATCGEFFSDENAGCPAEKCQESDASYELAAGEDPHDECCILKSSVALTACSTFNCPSDMVAITSMSSEDVCPEEADSDCCQAASTASPTAAPTAAPTPAPETCETWWAYEASIGTAHHGCGQSYRKESAKQSAKGSDPQAECCQQSTTCDEFWAHYSENENYGCPLQPEKIRNRSAGDITTGTDPEADCCLALADAVCSEYWDEYPNDPYRGCDDTSTDEEESPDETKKDEVCMGPSGSETPGVYCCKPVSTATCQDFWALYSADEEYGCGATGRVKQDDTVVPNTIPVWENAASECCQDTTGSLTDTGGA